MNETVWVALARRPGDKLPVVAVGKTASAADKALNDIIEAMYEMVQEEDSDIYPTVGRWKDAWTFEQPEEYTVYGRP